MIDCISLGNDALKRNHYCLAIGCYTKALESAPSPAGPLVTLLLLAYQRLYHFLEGQSHDSRKTAVQMEEAARAYSKSQDIKKIIGIAKVVGRQNVEVLLTRIARLAESTLLDPPYIAKQLGMQHCNPWDGAFHYYTAQNKKLRPNVLFDPGYYKSLNGLPATVDAVEHYLTEGARQHLTTHRLFDIKWYLTEYPSAAYAPCLITHYWRVGYSRHTLPCDPAQYSLDPMAVKLFFYGTFCPDPGFPSLHAPHMHASPEATRSAAPIVDYLQNTQAHPRYVPVDFAYREYRDLYPELKVLKDDFWECLFHYLRHGIEEARAHKLCDIFGYHPRDQRTYDANSLKAIQQKKPLCVLVHLYYVDMWDELAAYLRNIDADYDLYINMVDTTWSVAAVERIRKQFPAARIHISPNAGRDIGGYLRLLDSIPEDEYLCFALLHTKKSPHVSASYVSAWKNNLLESILGSQKIVASNLAAFAADPEIGIIGAAKHRHDHLGDNEAHYEQLLDLFEISAENRECEYVSGTMMLIRSEIFWHVHKTVKHLEFKNADHQGMDFLIDGQLEHAVERLFGNVMKQMGYRFLWR